MLNTGKLAGKTIFISGASRGIGKAIALKAAKDGARIIIAARTAEPHPKLTGTIYTAAKEIQEAGGQCLPCIVDIQDENAVRNAVEKGVEKFGGIDVLVNNASAIILTSTLATSMKTYDLLSNTNARGTYLCSQACIPYLQLSKNPHILNISPPLNMKPIWFQGHVAYTMAKYGMSMCVLGMAPEFKDDGVAVNALWPKTLVATSALDVLGSDIVKQCRKTDIMADAAYAIVTRDSRSRTGEFLIDEDVLKEVGVEDFESYSCVPGNDLLPDLFLSETEETSPGKVASQDEKNDELHQLFKKIKSVCNEETVSKINAVYQFNITDEGPWFLDLKTGSGDAGRGKPSTSPDVIFSMKKGTFIGLFSGKLTATSAFLRGKIKFEGDVMFVIKLEPILARIKSNL